MSNSFPSRIRRTRWPLATSNSALNSIDFDLFRRPVGGDEFEAITDEIGENLGHRRGMANHPAQRFVNLQGRSFVFRVLLQQRKDFCRGFVEVDSNARQFGIG